MKTNSNKNLIKRITIFISIVIIILLSILWILKTFVYPLKHFNIIKEESGKNNIDPYLVLAIIKAESGFNKNVTSAKQARGLMQIMDATAEEMNESENLDLNKESIYDENINIALGCKYFSSLIKKYDGNYYLAIIAYNAGMGNVDKWLKDGIIANNLDDIANNNIPFKETKNYLKKVINYYNVYRKLY